MRRLRQRESEVSEVLEVSVARGEGKERVRRGTLAIGRIVYMIGSHYDINHN